MTVIRSYSPNGLIQPDPDYQLCCGLFHATTAAKFFAITFFCICVVISGLNFALFGIEKQWISLFCVVYTVYCSILIYGVFMEKYSYLLPFLAIHGFLTIFLILFIFVLCGFGFSTDFIIDHHAENIHLRDLYKMHDMNPDDDYNQALVSGIALFSIVFVCVSCIFSWFAIFRAYKCYKNAKLTILPGDQIGIVAMNEEEHEENNA